jgi:phospho-N-acetylmuramoyl-pentapeptide-transferase
MSRSQKLILQAIFGFFLGFVILSENMTPYPKSIMFNLYIPFFKGPVLNLSWFYLLFIVFVVMAISNAVNFADGLDGLAIVPASVVAAVFGVFAYILGRIDYSTYLLFEHIPKSGEITVFCASVMGAGLGFLWYNTYPAQVFMGDVGSQSLGGVIAVTAILIKQEFLFLIAGGIFLAEALSVLIQDRIGIAKLGRRIFFRAPLHHTFQYRGIAEPTVVVRFWIVSILLALASFATLKIR